MAMEALPLVELWPQPCGALYAAASGSATSVALG